MNIYVPLELFCVGLKRVRILDVFVFGIELDPYRNISILHFSKIMLNPEGSLWRGDRLLVELPLRFGDHNLKLVHHVGKHDHLKNQGHTASKPCIISYVALIRERDFLPKYIELSEI